MENIDELMNHIASHLPDEFGIEIGIERDGACVHLVDEAGECVGCFEIGPQANGLEVAALFALGEALTRVSNPSGATLN